MPYTEYWGLTSPCVVNVLCCRLRALPAGSSVGRALCLESRVSWVRVPPLFPLKKVFSCFVCYALALHPLIHVYKLVECLELLTSVEWALHMIHAEYTLHLFRTFRYVQQQQGSKVEKAACFVSQTHRQYTVKIQGKHGSNSHLQFIQPFKLAEK